MRIATTLAYERSIATIAERQAKLLQAQNELGSGVRVDRPSDDPAGFAHAERLRSQASRLEVAQRMNDHARGLIGQSEAVLGQIGTRLQSLRDSLVAAGNPSFGAADRASLATAMRLERDEILRLANSRDAAGGYLFGGLGTRQAPFLESAGTVAFQATPGEQRVGFDAELPTSLDGDALFLSGLGAGGTDGVFTVLDAAIAVLDDPAADGAAVAQAVQDGLGEVDGAIDRFSTARSMLGQHLNMLDARDERSADDQIAIADRLASLIESDILQAASDVSRHQAAFDAAMKTYASIVRMSLFDQI